MTLVPLFAIQVLFNFFSKRPSDKQQLAEEVSALVQSRYKLLVSKLADKEVGCFSTCTFIGFLTMQCLVQNHFLEKNSEGLELLNYCVELVHYKLNGFKLTSNALTRHIDCHFHRLYNLRTKSKSVINIAMQKNHFENNESAHKSHKGLPESLSLGGSCAQQVERFLEGKVADLKKDYEGVVDGFMKVMKGFVDKKDSHNQVDSKIPDFDKASPSASMFRKNALNIHSLGSAIEQTTANSKKKFYVSRLTRFRGPGRRPHSESASGQPGRSREHREGQGREGGGAQAVPQERADLLQRRRRGLLQQPQRRHQPDLQTETRQVLLLRKANQGL